LNLSASPYTRQKHKLRRTVLTRRARELGAPIVYCNQVGAQAELLFEGDSMVVMPDGTVFQSLLPFETGSETVELARGSDRILGKQADDKNEDELERLFRGLVTGIRDYLTKSRASERLILGLSGGIDSALVAVLAAEAVGPERVTALTLPSGFSSPGSVDDSVLLADALGVTLHELSIEEMYDQAVRSLAPLFGDRPFGVAEENVQSRIRGLLLMAMANKFGDLLLTTGNKSELATGYATLYGDMNGGLNPIGDLYKQDVYALSRWINDVWYGREVIPVSILEKAPSAELRPDQTDQDSLPPYDLLDPVLEAYLERRLDLDEIVSLTTLSRVTVSKLLSLVDRNEFKRYQAPPILKVTARAFGMGRRWPLVQGWSHSRERFGPTN
ncbi:MAG: NAD(+) synthase, partial [Balneolaceae bacterium]